MAQTENLGLKLFEGQMVVDYNDFNAAWEAIDVVGKDYIIEKGWNGRWWWRKWNSGRAECGVDKLDFGTLKLQNFAVDNTLTCSQELSFQAYPFTFYERPFVDIQFEWARTPNEVLAFVAQKAQSGSSESPAFRLVNFNKNTAQITGAVFGIYVCGKWKQMS